MARSSRAACAPRMRTLIVSVASIGAQSPPSPCPCLGWRTPPHYRLRGTVLGLPLLFLQLPLLDFMIDRHDGQPVVQELRMLVVDPTRHGQVGPLHRLAEDVQPQALRHHPLNGLAGEHRTRRLL